MISGAVLVVDDERGVRVAVGRMLESLGYRVIEAANGREGIARYRDHASELPLVLLDMTMPEMRGDEVIRELRKVDPDVSIVLSSGYGELEAMRSIEPGSVAAFLEKPYTMQQLTDALSRANASRRRAPG